MKLHTHPTRVLPSALLRATLLAPLLISALVLLSAVPAGAAPQSAAGGHDIGELMTAAEEHYDLTRLDAVLLLEDLTVTVAAGSRRTTVHRVAWLGTEIGLDAYGDLRIPHNTGTSTLEVVALRTWMDGRWWPDESEISPTAVVETTPGAIQSADDYTTMRETMLLHDGIELPCIVETIYTITERRPAQYGFDGLWTFPKADPAVMTRLAIEVPKGMTLHHAERNGAPEPALDRSGADTDTYVWRAEFVDRLARPLTGGATAYAPHVAWSTWESWGALGEAVAASVRAAASVNEALADSVANLVDGRPVPLARAEAVADFINETTRAVRYDDSHWQFAPREAVRTWNTAYGHRLDRAVLAAALFEEAGCAVTPAFRSAALCWTDDGVPTLARFDGLLLHLDDIGALYDPLSGALLQGRAGLTGRSLWLAGRDDSPGLVVGEEISACELVLSVEPGEEEGWTGSGILVTTGALSCYGDVAGLEGQAGSHLSRVASAALAGASVEDHSLAVLEDERVVAGFSFSIDDPEPDDSGRTRFELGDPAGGLLASLPPHVHLYVEHRDSPVMLPDAVVQTLTLRIDVGDREVVRMPEEVTLENDVGHFRLTVEHEGSEITITREIAVGPSAGDDASDGVLTIGPAEWPSLRALLLEEADPRNRTILLQ
jgi:hypothetical protein